MNEDNAYSPEKCPRCGDELVCKPNDIGNCHCNQVSISKPEYDYINSKFSGCLCNACLHVLKHEFSSRPQTT